MKNKNVSSVLMLLFHHCSSGNFVMMIGNKNSILLFNCDTDSPGSMLGSVKTGTPKGARLCDTGPCSVNQPLKTNHNTWGPAEEKREREKKNWHSLKTHSSFCLLSGTKVPKQNPQTHMAARDTPLTEYINDPSACVTPFKSNQLVSAKK